MSVFSPSVRGGNKKRWPTSSLSHHSVNSGMKRFLQIGGNKSFLALPGLFHSDFLSVMSAFPERPWPACAGTANIILFVSWNDSHGWSPTCGSCLDFSAQRFLTVKIYTIVSKDKLILTKSTTQWKMFLELCWRHESPLRPHIQYTQTVKPCMRGMSW